MNAIVTDKKVKSGETFKIVASQDASTASRSYINWQLDSNIYRSDAKYYLQFRNSDKILFRTVLKYLTTQSGEFTLRNVASNDGGTGGFEVTAERTGSNTVYTVVLGSKNINNLFTTQEIGYFE